MFWTIIFMFSSVRWPFQCRGKIRFIGGGGGSQLGVPKARAAGGGVQVHAPSKNFEI